MTSVLSHSTTVLYSPYSEKTLYSDRIWDDDFGPSLFGNHFFICFFFLRFFAIRRNENPGWIADGSVPEYEQFTNEPKAKRYRRHKKYGKEALEAAAAKRDMDKKNKSSGSLEQQLMKRQAERGSNANSFFDHLLEKYGGADDSEEYEIPAKKKKKPAAAKTPSKAASKTTPSKAATKATKKATATKTSPKSSPKAAMNKVKNGRVSKRKWANGRVSLFVSAKTKPKQTIYADTYIIQE